MLFVSCALKNALVSSFCRLKIRINTYPIVQRIDRITVDKIYESARVEEVVGDFVSLKRRGTNMLGLCPFHDEKTPSFMVSPAKGIYKCFGCGKGGNAVNFIMEVEQLSYYEALKQVAEKYHIVIEEKALSAHEQKQFDDRDGMMVLNEFARKYFSEQMTETADGRTIGLSYFKQRGFSDLIIEKFNLGYAPEGKDVFVREAINKGYREEYLSKTGLATIKADYKRDRFAGRVMFPIHGQTGKILAFAGRTLSSEKTIAKYINSPESEIYHKSNVLYGIYHAKKEIQRKDNCFMVEGYTDVMSFHQSGIENVVASSGTSLTKGQIKLIKRFTDNITVIYDGDNAGIKASLRGIDLILEQGLNVKTLLLPDGEDPDSFAKSMGASELVKYIEDNSTDFIHFKANLLMEGAQNDPIKMAKLIQEIVQSISVIPNEITRAVYIKACSTLLGVPEGTLYNESNKIIDKHQQDLEKDAERKRNRERYESRAANSSSSHTPNGMGLPDGPPLDFGMPADLEPLAPNAIPSAAPIAPKVEMDVEESMLVMFLLRYGEMKMFSEGDQYYEQYPDTTAADFIIGQLTGDELVLGHPVLNEIYEEYKKLYAEGQEKLEQYFAHHENQEIVNLVVHLIADQHQLSNMYASSANDLKADNRLGELVPRVVTEFKLFCVMKEITRVEEVLKNPNAAESEFEKAFAELNHYNAIKIELSKFLGGRTLLRR